MKQLVNSLKQGGAIGEMFNRNQGGERLLSASDARGPAEEAQQQRKADRLEELKKQRQALATVEVGSRGAGEFPDGGLSGSVYG